MDVTGVIDIQTCADIVSTSYENLLPIGAFFGIIALVAIVLFVLYTIECNEKKLMKNYMRKQGLLNKYEEWKHERRLNE